jgi:hypothetical protein
MIWIALLISLMFSMGFFCGVVWASRDRSEEPWRSPRGVAPATAGSPWAHQAALSSIEPVVARSLDDTARWRAMSARE